jgi:L-rhamnose mutarotase
MQKWWKITDQMQWQVLEAKDNEWWHEINENFHVD